MSASPALVSVVITCYNQGRFLGEAIESALVQTHPTVEIVVVNDGSTDDTEAVARRYASAILLAQPNRGLACARNAGLRHSRGEYIVFLDADDCLMPEAIAMGLVHLERYPEAACTFGRCIVIDSHSNPRPTVQLPPVGDDAYEELLQHNPIRMPALVIHRRRALEQVGGFDPQESAAADYGLYLRLARQFPLCGHEAVVANYRQHDANMSGDPVLMLTSTLAALRAERRYARGRPDHRRAYRIGMRFWRGFYGDPVVTRLRADIRAERWGRAMTALLVLARYWPAGLAKHVARKVFLSVTPASRRARPKWRLRSLGL